MRGTSGKTFQTSPDNRVVDREKYCLNWNIFVL